jgi:hypothetical protein
MLQLEKTSCRVIPNGKVDLLYIGFMSRIPQLPQILSLPVRSGIDRMSNSSPVKRRAKRDSPVESRQVDEPTTSRSHTSDLTQSAFMSRATTIDLN